MVYKRLLAGMLSCFIVASSGGVSAFADTKTADTSFTATADMLGGGLIVTIPDNVALTKSGDEFVGTGKVTAQGITSPKSVLSVSTNPKITYANQYKSDITVDASVSFGTDCSASWTASELKANLTAEPKLGYDITATVPFSKIDYIGTYKTNILFNISLSTDDKVMTYYMGYKYSDSSDVSYANQYDIAYDILPQTDMVAELKEFSTNKEEIEAKGYDMVIESSDKNLVIPSSMENIQVVGVCFETLFSEAEIAAYIEEVEVPDSVKGVELSNSESSISTAVITCDNVRSAVNVSKKLPDTATIRFKFEANGERDYTEFFDYHYENGKYYVCGFSQYGYDTLKSYGTDSIVEISLPVTYNGSRGVAQVAGIRSDVAGAEIDFSDSLSDSDMPQQEWVLPDNYDSCLGFWCSGFNTSNPCTKLKSVTFNEGLTEIHSDAFKYCTGFESVVIPSSVTTIKSDAFYGCTNLKNVVFKDGFDGSIEDNVFMDTGITEVTLPDSCTSLNGYAFGNNESSNGYNSNVVKIKWGISHDTAEVTNSSGITYTRISFADGDYIGADSRAVKAIATSDDGVSAVLSCDTIESSYKNTEGKAYKNLILTDSIVSIGKSAFDGCTASISRADLRNAVTVGTWAFCDTTIDTCIIKDTFLATEYVFHGAKIKNLYIDYTDSEATLAKYATNNAVIENVYFSGTEEQYIEFLGSRAGNALRDNKDTINVVYQAQMP